VELAQEPTNLGDGLIAPGVGLARDTRHEAEYLPSVVGVNPTASKWRSRAWMVALQGRSQHHIVAVASVMAQQYPFVVRKVLSACT
jgi:hypothetical protein